MANDSGVVYLSPENEVISAAPEELPSGTAQLAWPTTGVTTVASLNTHDRPSEGEVSGQALSSPAVARTYSRTSSQLAQSLSNLAELIANITESYSSVIFVFDSPKEALIIGGAHTLSRDFVDNATIRPGQGLVGWTAQNKKRISVSQFQHDSSTLLYYSRDQALKSFVAVPILDSDNELHGIIACDSKKSYAFAKVTEKLLLDCAVQACTLIKLHRQLTIAQKDPQYSHSLLDQVIEQLRSAESEEQLLTLAAKLPQELIERDALVVMATSQGGIGKGVFYSATPRSNFSSNHSHPASPQSNIEHRLLELVCRHKKVICAERSVQALPTTDIQQRSFLSVPFHVLGREAGALNLLSKPQEAFSASHIAVLERIAEVAGRELERVRLKERFTTSGETSGILSWNHFSIRAQSLLADAKTNRIPLSLVRLRLNNIIEIEDLAGVEVAIGVLQKMMRLIEQAKRGSSIATYLYGCEILLLTETGEVERTMGRLQALLQRLTPSDITQTKVPLVPKFGSLITSGIDLVVADYPRDGETLSELVAKTCRLAELKAEEKSVEVKAAHGGRRA